MTDKKDLIRIMEVFEDTTGSYEIGEVAWAIFNNDLDNHIKTYGKKDLIKALKLLIKKVKTRHKELKK